MSESNRPCASRARLAALVVALACASLACARPVAAQDKTGPYGWTAEERFRNAGRAQFEKDFRSGDFGRIAAQVAIYKMSQPGYQGRYTVAPLLDARDEVNRLFGREVPYRPTLAKRMWQGLDAGMSELSKALPKTYRGVVDTSMSPLRAIDRGLAPLTVPDDPGAPGREAIRFLPGLDGGPGARLDWSLAKLQTKEGRDLLANIYGENVRVANEEPLVAHSIRLVTDNKFDPTNLSDVAVDGDLRRFRAEDADPRFAGTYKEKLARGAVGVARGVREKATRSARAAAAGRDIASDPGDGGALEDESEPDAGEAKSTRADPDDSAELQRDIVRAQFVVGLVSGILKSLGGDAAQVGRALEVIGGAAMKAAQAAILFGTASFAFPLAILGGISDLFSLFTMGPDPMQLVLEELQALRREFGEFRYENRVRMALLHQDLIERTEAIQFQLDAATLVLQEHLDRIEGRVVDAEASLNQLVNQLTGYHQQILGRIGDLFKLVAVEKELQTYAVLRPDLIRPAGQSNSTLDVEYDRLMAQFSGFAIQWGASPALAGGDRRAFDAYSPAVLLGMQPEELSKVIVLTDEPRGAWFIINDYANLAASVGVPIPPAGRLDASPRIGMPGQQLVNPESWRLGAAAYLDLAAGAPDRFRRPPVRDEYARRLAAMYLQGERVRTWLDSLTRENSSTQRTAVFDRLAQAMEGSVDHFESVLISRGQDLADSVGIDFWAADPLDPSRVPVLAPPAIGPERPRPGGSSRVDIRLAPSQLGFVLPEALPLTDEERARLDRALPACYRLATRVNWPGQLDPDRIEWSFDEVRLEDVRKVMRRDYNERAKWRVGQQPPYGTYGSAIELRDGFLVPYTDTPEYRGRVALFVRCDFLPGGQELARRTILRKKLKTPAEVLIGGEKTEKYEESNPRHRPAENFEGEGRKIRDTSHTEGGFLGIGGSDVHDAVVLDEPMEFRRRQLAEHWASMKAQLLDPATPDVDAPRTKEATERQKAREQMELRLTRLAEQSLLGLQLDAVRDTQDGLGEIGRAFRTLHAAQGALRAFAGLALPEQLAADPELASLVGGDHSVLHWSTIDSLMKPGGGPPATAERLKKDGFAVARPGGVVQAGPGDKPVVPAAAEMRLRLARLRTRLNEAIADRAASGRPPSQPEIESMLYQIVWRAPFLGVDLEAELKKLEIEPGPHWMLRQPRRDAERLGALAPGLDLQEPHPALLLEATEGGGR
jgi:hypothetical protein